MLDTTSGSRGFRGLPVFLVLLLAFSATACNGGPTEPTLDQLPGIYTGTWRGTINGWQVVLHVRADPGNAERWIPVGLDGTGTALDPATGESHSLTISGQAVGRGSTLFYLGIPMVVGPGGVILGGGQGVGRFSGGVLDDGRTWPGRFTSSTSNDFNAAPFFGGGDYDVTLTKD